MMPAGNAESEAEYQRTNRRIAAVMPWVGTLVAFGFWYFVLPMPRADSAAPAAGDAAAVQVIVKGAVAVLLILALVRTFRGGAVWKAWQVFREFRPVIIAQAIAVCAVTVATVLLLERSFPGLNRSWLYWTPMGSGQATNIVALPLRMPYLGPPFLLLFAINIPYLAEQEERMYRKGTRDWNQAVARSIRFGLAHCWSGVPLFVALGLSVAGVWFSLQYFRGGVERSTLHHATYNLLIVALLLAWLVFGVV